MCNGINKRGERCGTQFGLDANGFCRHHRPNAQQCFGIAKWSGKRCCIRWGLNSSGYCKYHTNQAPPVYEPVGSECEPYVKQCQGIAVSTGRRCRKDWELYPNGYSCYHQGQAPIMPARLVLRPIKTQGPHHSTQQAGARWAARWEQRRH